VFKDTTHLFVNTKPINRRKARKAMLEFYRYCRKKNPSKCSDKDPKITFVNGPTELAAKIDLNKEGHSFFDFNDIAHFVTKRGVSRHDRLKSRISSIFWKYGRVKTNGGYIGSSALLIPEDYEYQGEYEWDKHATAIWDESLVTINFKDESFIVERPKVIRTNERGFHFADGPALVFRDGTELYFWEGEEVKKEHFLNPQAMTLNDIHSYNNKHIIIDMVGVDHYLELVKAWKPDVKGKFKKFFAFSKMIVPEDANAEKPWDRRGYGDMHKERPYKVILKNAEVNGVRGLVIREQTFGETFHFPGSLECNPFKHKYAKKIFNKRDKELWDILNIEDAMFYGHAMQIEIGFMNGKFWVKDKSLGEDTKYPLCHMDVAPAWFRAKMFRKQEAIYEGENYTVRWKDGEFEISGDIKPNRNLFGGNENVPDYSFHFYLESDSWEGLLEKWARFAFEWVNIR
jgi:hypothetical protein